jgi:ABC-type Zn uptake system ZnuABC Zn-binding protein ZnuA
MIYISGCITGNENWKQDFQKAEEYLKSNGYKVIINPLNLSEQVNKEIKNPTYIDYMKQDIEILTLCDEIYILRGWWRSKGAKLERHIAKALGMKIIYQKRGDK